MYFNNVEVKRGDIWYADLGICKGSIQGGKRPFLILQNDTGNKYSSVVVGLAITSRTKKLLPTHVNITLIKDSIILAEQVRTINKFQLDEKLDSIDEETMKQVEWAAMFELGIDIEATIRERIQNIRKQEQIDIEKQVQKRLEEINNKKRPMDEIKVVTYIKNQIQIIKDLDIEIMNASKEERKGSLGARRFMISTLKLFCKNNNQNFYRFYNEKEIEHNILQTGAVNNEYCGVQTI